MAAPFEKSEIDDSILEIHKSNTWNACLFHPREIESQMSSYIKDESFV